MPLENGDRIVSCDGCPDAAEFDKVDFATAMDTVARWGWKTVKTPKGEWQHFCRVCVEDNKHVKAGEVKAAKDTSGLRWRKRGGV